MEINNINSPEIDVQAGRSPIMQRVASEQGAADIAFLKDATQSHIPITMSPQMLQNIHMLRGLYPNESVLKGIRDLLDFLSLFSADSGSAADSVLRQSAEAVEKALSAVYVPLQSKEFGVPVLKSLVQLYFGSESLKLMLLSFKSALQKMTDRQVRDAGAAKVNSLLTYLDEVQFLNQEGMKNVGEAQALLYIPFSVGSDSAEENMIELVIYPEFSEKGILKQGEFSFGMSIETDYLGTVRLFFKVLDDDVSCSVTVDTYSVKQTVDSNQVELSEKLRQASYVLKSLNCYVNDKQHDYVSQFIGRFEANA